MTLTTDTQPADSRSDDPAFALHQGGKIEVASRTPLDGPDDLSLAYTPGVGRVSQAVADEPELVWSLTGRSNAVAVLSKYSSKSRALAANSSTGKRRSGVGLANVYSRVKHDASRPHIKYCACVKSVFIVVPLSNACSMSCVYTCT